MPAAVKVTQYAHADAALWPLIGPHLVSREVHAALGGPVLSDAATTWWVATRGKAVVGFAAVQRRKDGLWLHAAYVLPGERDEGVHTALADARDAHLKTLPAATVKVCCRADRWPHYEARGFRKDRDRGTWVYGSRLTAPTVPAAKEAT